MEYAAAKLDEIVLALLYLNVSTTARAWITGSHLKPEVEGEVGGAHGRRSSPRRGVIQEALW